MRHLKITSPSTNRIADFKKQKEELLSKMDFTEGELEIAFLEANWELLYLESKEGGAESFQQLKIAMLKSIFSCAYSQFFIKENIDLETLVIAGFDGLRKSLDQGENYKRWMKFVDWNIQNEIVRKIIT